MRCAPWLVVALVGCGSPSPAPSPSTPLRDLTTYACLGPTACVPDDDTPIPARAAGLIIDARGYEGRVMETRALEATLRVRVTHGETLRPRVMIQMAAPGTSLFVEGQEIACYGEGEREIDEPAGTRVVVHPLHCTRYALSPGQCPQQARELAIVVAPDGSVSIPTFETRMDECAGGTTRRLHIALARAAPVTPPADDASLAWTF